MTLVVRDAVVDDLDALLELLCQLREGASRDIPWDDADAERAAIVWREILADGRRAVVVAEERGRVVGTADLIVVANLTRGARPVAFVENVVVTAERRGEGVGRALMDDVRARGRVRAPRVGRAAVAGCMHRAEPRSARVRRRRDVRHDPGDAASPRGVRRLVPVHPDGRSRRPHRRGRHGAR